MATRELSSVDVQERDDFDRLLGDLSQSRGMTVTLDIDSDAEVLHSAAEFDELAVLAQENDVDVWILTDDPLRRELALIYGLTIVSTPENATTSILRSPDMQTTVVRGPVASGAHVATVGDEAGTPEVPESDRTPSGTLLAPRGGAVLDPDASFSFVLAPPGARKPQFMDTAGFEAGVPKRAAAHRAGTSGSSTGKAISASALVVSGVVIAVAVAVLLVGLLAPSARVVLVPQTQVIASQVSYAVAPVGAHYDVVIEPTVVADTIRVELAAPASGSRQVPDAAAQGMIFLTNPLSRPVIIPAGTLVTSLDGELGYLTNEEIEVPAADPFGAATFGTAVVDVSAVEAGPAGNLATGELAGELDSGVLYQNRFPLDGGTMRSETFVTRDDLTALEQKAEQQLRKQVGSALTDDIEPGWELLGDPKAGESMVASFSAEAGDVVDEVSIVGELRVEAEVYDPAELHRAARLELERKLSAGTPEGFALLLDSVEMSSPQPVETESGVAFQMTSQATIEAYIDPEIESALADELTGKSESSAVRVLENLDGLASYSVSYGPDWLPWEPVPRFSNRISVNIDAS